eukprot:TRINITY_DN5895_c0_g1_i2.p1 TRINITY_DN5895_c0_g1~~TRINITY_DN5895_c0_g1_i2.p1  ORF type:complete len:211 (-),score=27.98 TRINITY_DN5895_c0_g1_i2:1874-2506(-)
MSQTLQSEIQPPQRKKQPKNDDFYVNLGYAIRTLRDEIPLLFEQDLTYDIYRDDIVYRDPRNAFYGKKNYQNLFWSLRFFGKIFFSQVTVEIRRMCQLEEDVLKMQWTVRAVPRLPWRTEQRLDGYSIYKLDDCGKIYEHQVDNVIFRDPPFQRIPRFADVRWWEQLGPQRVPQPGIYGIDKYCHADTQFWITAMLLVGAWNLTHAPPQC